MKAVVKKRLGRNLFIRPVDGSIKQQVEAAIDECCLTQRRAQTGKLDKTVGPKPQSRLSSGEKKESGNTLMRKGSRH